MSGTNIKNWYSGKNVFITGATGFLGVALLEKLLRTVPDIAGIYLLLRPKKGKSIDERLNELKTNSVFDKLIQTQSIDLLFKKVKAISGDVGQPELGLSLDDRALLIEHLDVIFHSAATLDFAEPLKATVDVNLLGTRRCLELGKQCKHLMAFVHVSSAYVNSFKTNEPLEEVVYPLPEHIDVEEIIKLTESSSDEEIDAATPQILGNHPNTYTITKHMAEHEVLKCQQLFPCTIVRPSMILCAWKEPIPGWTVSKNGPSGFLMGASKGVIRRIPTLRDSIYDYIPVDVVVNQLIVAGFYSGVTASKKLDVYHCTSSNTNPFRWMMVEDKINASLHKYPLKSAVWYPHLKLVSSIEWFKISAFFVHFLPALVLDFVTQISGGRPILKKLHRNVNSSLDRLKIFIYNEWIFKNDKTKELHEWMNPIDQKDFNLDISNLSWVQFFDELAKGARVYLSKEKMTNLSVAKGKDTILMILHYGFQATLYIMIWMLISFTFDISFVKSAISVPITYGLFSLL